MQHNSNGNTDTIGTSNDTYQYGVVTVTGLVLTTLGADINIRPYEFLAASIAGNDLQRVLGNQYCMHY